MRLRDGTDAVIRPLHRVPREALDEAWADLSPESRFNRFLSAVPHLTDEMFHRFYEDVDWVDHVALFLVALPDEGLDSIVGVGRILRYPDRPETADVAVTVREKWHGRGVATALLAELVRRRPVGVTTILTRVADDNPAALRMLQRLGPTSVSDGGEGALRVLVDLQPAEPPTTSEGAS